MPLIIVAESIVFGGPVGPLVLEVDASKGKGVWCPCVSFFAPPPRGGLVLRSSYTGEGRHLGSIVGIPWPGSEAGLGVHVDIIRSYFAVCAAIVAAVGAAAGCLFSRLPRGEDWY